MFGKSTEKRVAREADKIVSLKEDMDAISWTRVLEIGKLLQEGVEEADRVALARELVSIAQSNRSLYTRLGIEPAPAPARVMASGIEVLEGGLAEAAIEERVEQVEKRALPPVAVPSPAEPEPRADEPSETDFQAAEVQVECDLVAKNDPDEDDFAEAAQAARAGEPAPEPVQAPVPAPEPAPAEPESEPGKPLTIDELIAAATQLEEAVDELEAAAAEIDEPAASETPAASDDPTAPLQPVAAAPESVPQSEPQQTSEPEPAPHPEPQAKPQPKLAKKRRFARFRNLYESRDGGLCVFEDEHGHLVAVDSSKLA